MPTIEISDRTKEVLDLIRTASGLKTYDEAIQWLARAYSSLAEAQLKLLDGCGAKSNMHEGQ